MDASEDALFADERAQEFLRLLSTCDLRLNAFILALMPNWTDAQDIGQEVRITLWKQFDEYDRSKDFATWCRTIAYYKILAFRKDSSRYSARMSTGFLDKIADEAARTPDDEQSRQQALIECLRQLDERIRTMLLRYYSGEETIHEIAERLGRTYDATRQSVLRTRNWLRKCIESSL